MRGCAPYVAIQMKGCFPLYMAAGSLEGMKSRTRTEAHTKIYDFGTAVIVEYQQKLVKKGDKLWEQTFKD